MSKHLETRRIPSQLKPFVMGNRIRRITNSHPTSLHNIQPSSTTQPDPSKILVWINTFNRVKELSLLLEDIYNYQDKYNIKIFVLDDFSKDNYNIMLNRFSNRLDIVYQKVNKNHGKQFYWMLCNYALNYIKSEESNYKYFIKLDDDCRLVPDFFKKNINIWNKIKDPKKICLNFRLDSREGKPVWTRVLPRLLRFEGTPIYLSQWVDMDFFCESSMFKALDYKINEQNLRRWLKNPTNSSGVGRDISVRLVSKGYHLYLTAETLAIHDNHDSKMNPEERNRNPLTTKLVTNLGYGL